MPRLNKKLFAILLVNDLMAQHIAVVAIPQCHLFYALHPGVICECVNNAMPAMTLHELKML